MRQSVQDDAGRYTGTGTGGYEAVSDYAKDIAWREKLDEMVYEDRKSGWTPGGEVIGAGHRDYSEGVMSEWNDFTGGQIPIPELAGFNNIKIARNSRDISQSEIIADKVVPGLAIGGIIGAATGGTAGLIAEAAGKAIPPLVSALLPEVGSGIGSVISEASDKSLKSSGPSETFRIIARDEDQKITAIYEATKYSQGGIDMVTTYRADGVVDGYVTRDYYPYDSFSED